MNVTSLNNAYPDSRISYIMDGVCPEAYGGMIDFLSHNNKCCGGSSKESSHFYGENRSICSPNATENHFEWLPFFSTVGNSFLICFHS